jgi:TonB family protein
MLRKVKFIAVGVVSVAIVALAAIATAQNGPTESKGGRKVTTRVAPTYPELARKMHIRGVVKVEAVVKPNGSVKSTRILGGNPVLIEAAMDAVNKWKFEPGPDDTTEVVQLSFEPQ